MASLQIRSGAWRVIFRYQGSQHFVIIGEVEETEAQGVKARYEYLLRLLKQRLLASMDIVTFLGHDGKPPDATSESRQPEITLARFRDGYIKTMANGAVESNSLDTSKIHLAHLADTLGERFPIASIAHADLQRQGHVVLDGLQRVEDHTAARPGQVWEQAVLNRIVLRAVRRVMRHTDLDAQSVRQLLEVLFE